jgi:hypothetical protein
MAKGILKRINEKILLLALIESLSIEFVEEGIDSVISKEEIKLIGQLSLVHISRILLE